MIGIAKKQISAEFFLSHISMGGEGEIQGITSNL